MRVATLITVSMLAVIPAAFAQQPIPQPQSTVPPSTTTQPPDPNNCGTPDEPKPCPPMPRRSLNRYPANKE